MAPRNRDQKAYKHGIEAPEIGRWYRNLGGSLFEVVAVDDHDGTIEIQHFDGTLEETEPEGWIAMLAEPAEAPEDWTGSVDINAEDFPGSRQPLFLDWQSKLEQLDEPEPNPDQPA
ncbi:MAG: hypothetical protein QF897_05600 [Gammaproteobacteria bacterium]|nr:hypothetical protein [Chromatiales bacterium]MDP7153905.1 hypothetical protein [Gammaproteobacteria bacterium]MDP7270234.1 hypothetical protein [Gammaproteobacteria bacterium]HJP05169.1 DUF6763 family protein [Gammaproteobacteria bacterium]